MKKNLFAMTAIAMLASGSFVQADVVDTRIAAMKTIGDSLGVLGGMARGRSDYDPDAAQAAADAILAVTRADAMTAFPEGTDNANHPKTRATAAIWDNWDDFSSKYNGLADGAAALAAEASAGKDDMVAAFGGVAGTCRACHQAYRGPRR